MSAGGSFNPSANPSGGPIDNQQGLQTSPNPSPPPAPNPSPPPADYSMGYARNFQTPSFYNPFSGYYGANTGMGGFQSQFGGFQQPQYGGFQQPQYGGFQQQQFGGFGGGFQQPQFGGFGGFGGGFQQPQYGGFQQPQYGGGFSQPSFRNPFGRGFNPRTMPPQMQPQPQPMPQPMPINSQPPQQSGDLFSIGRPPGDAMPATGGGLFSGSTTDPNQSVQRYHTGAFGSNFGGGGMGGYGNNQPRPQPYNPATGRGFGDGGIGGFGGFNPMMGGLGDFAYGMPNRQPDYGDSRMGRGLRQADNYADMRMPQPQVRDFVPTEYSVIADLARAKGISTPMMTLEESTQGTGNYTGRATDYYKQQLGAKNIDFGESALAPYRQKIIENYENERRSRDARFFNA